MLKIYKKSLIFSVLIPCVINSMEYFYEDLKNNEQKSQTGIQNNSYRVASRQSSPGVINNNTNNNNNLSPVANIIDVESYSSSPYNTSPYQSVNNTPEPITKKAYSPSVSRFRYQQNGSPFNSPIPSRVVYDFTPKTSPTDETTKLSKNILALIQKRKKEAQLSCCDKSNLSWEHLMAHLNDHPRDNDKKIQCCGISFSNKTYAADHVATKHNKSTIFHCPNCPKKYSATESLRGHYVKCVKNLTAQSIILIPEETDSPASSEPDVSFIENPVSPLSVSYIHTEPTEYERAFNRLFPTGMYIGDMYLQSWQELVRYFHAIKEQYHLHDWICITCNTAYSSAEGASSCYLNHIDQTATYNTQLQNTIDLDKLLPLDGDVSEFHNNIPNFENQSNYNTNINNYDDTSHLSPGMYLQEAHQPHLPNYESYLAENECLDLLENAELMPNNHEHAANVHSGWPQQPTSPIYDTLNYNAGWASNTDVVPQGYSLVQPSLPVTPRMMPEIIDLEESNATMNITSVPATPVAPHELPKTPMQEIPDRKKYEHAVGIGLKNEIEKIRFERLERERLKFFSQK
ncbi:hypothetical protein Noda2021_01490 [Candidatus Dependentiae bacterium Noda2021]|nr:hypothetical protein Noda2021_01490 [Candidatus Dependentiae bacterium Noda2021]